MNDKKPAKAAPMSIPAAPKADAPLTGYVKPAKVGIYTSPCLFTKGDAPQIGAKVKFQTPGGKLHTATVAHITDINGETRVGFKDDIRRA